GGQVRGLFVFREQLRSGVKDMLAWCRDNDLHVEVLTGDHVARGLQLAEELDVPVRAGLLPDEKQQAVRQLRDQFGPVFMVGDGINDAPALATADVGAAMGCGTDVSRYSADVCLLGNDLARIPQMIQLSRETVHTIRWNLLWAFAYNTVGVIIAAAGLLNPMIAAAAMVVSSLLVVSNALRLGGEPNAVVQAASGNSATEGGEAMNSSTNEAQARAYSHTQGTHLARGNGRIEHPTSSEFTSDRESLEIGEPAV
ncbi:MAG: cation-translocating P-type ATPase, partial [Planctomycetales bacterium]|nr:cation-translocating P-type ATPase [Planctomycetales bacterium]